MEKGEDIMSRLERIRQQMREAKIDAYVVIRPENGRYLSGFSGGEATLYITSEKALLLTDFRYIEQAKAQAPEFEIVNTGQDHLEALEEIGKQAQVDRAELDVGDILDD